MNTPLTYTKAQLMQALQQSRDEGFYNLLATLEPHGFPKRLPRLGNAHALWSRPAVDAWMANWGQAKPTTPNATSVEQQREYYELQHTHQ